MAPFHVLIWYYCRLGSFCLECPSFLRILVNNSVRPVALARVFFSFAQTDSISCDWTLYGFLVDSSFLYSQFKGTLFVLNSSSYINQKLLVLDVLSYVTCTNIRALIMRHFDFFKSVVGHFLGAELLDRMLNRVHSGIPPGIVVDRTARTHILQRKTGLFFGLLQM